MPRYPAVTRAASKIQAKTKRWPVTLCNAAGDITPGASAAVGATGYVHVVMPDGSVLKAFNSRIPAATGRRAWAGYEPHNPTFFRILDFNASYASPSPGSGFGPHAPTHAWLAADSIYVHARQLLPLRVAPAGGLTVRLEPSPMLTASGWDLSGAPVLDLTALLPIAGSRFALVYLDGAGVLSARAGTVMYAVPLPYTAIPSPLTGETPLAAAVLFAGQTAIVENTTRADIVDLRFVGTAAGGGAAAEELWEALGDLIVGTGPATAERLPVGSDGQFLAASSSAPLGLDWVSAPSGGGGGGGGGAGQLLGLARWAADGAATAYNLPDVAEGVLLATDNGAAVDPFTLTLSADGTTLTWDTAPTAAHVLQALYVKAASGAGASTASAYPYSLFQARLTLTSGVPVPTADITAATTLYLTPHQGDLVGLYTSGAWEVVPLTQLSISLAGKTANLPYDVFVYNNGGTLALELVAWSNVGARATALASQNGIYCKTGALDRRYCGTICITATTGQCEDSTLRRFVWNCYNRAVRFATVPNHDNHTYSGVLRLYNNSTTDNQVELVLGLAEDTLTLVWYGKLAAGVDGQDAILQIWMDGAQSGGNLWNANAQIVEGSQMHYGFAAIGYHYFNVYEFGTNAACSFGDMSLRVAVPM